MARFAPGQTRGCITTMDALEIERIEITLLLEAVFQRYGHDFRSYARASMERRIRQVLQKSGFGSISQLIPEILHDESFFERMIAEFSITVTEMFRDPAFFQSLRHNVAPLLRTYPFVRIWHAGCATGEEAYSLAILLLEENLYERATVFATDFNDAALEKAAQGIYSIENIKQFTLNYQKSGGTASFSEYYHAHYDSIAVNQALKKNITFANHNLATDRVFGEMNLILCRNVLIYFDKTLQNRVLELFCESLAHGGFLCLGSKESLQFSSVARCFKPVDEKMRIFQKIASLENI